MDEASSQLQPAGAAVTARGAALGLIRGVVRDGRPVSDLIAGGALAGLAPADRARAQRLALSTLRHWQQAGRFAAPFLRKGPPPEVDAVLRMALAEVFAEGAPAHDAVNAAVGAVRSGGRRSEGFAGLVNAVLRRACARGQAEWDALPADELPGWLRGRLLSAYGKRAVLAIEAAHRRGPATDLTPRDPARAGEIAARLGGQVLPTGTVRLAGGGQVSTLAGYAGGEWWVQDAAAALPVRALGELRGTRVLDLCAAPGGKTLQLAAGGAEVTALDLSAPRLERLRENLARCGLSARIEVADALHWEPETAFDAVMLDAPCTATGTIRRHPDLPFVRTAEGLRDLVALQERLIDRALGFVRPGGVCVFATCSLLPEEGERQVAAALDRHRALGLAAATPEIAGLDPAWRSPEGGVRLRPDYWPDYGGLDGFYFAALRRPG